jgi:hypothetical protein
MRMPLAAQSDAISVEAFSGCDTGVSHESLSPHRF